MKLGITLTVAFILLAAAPALAAPVSYQYGGKTYYLVDGNNPNLNSGDRVCQSMGLTCMGYTAHTGSICKHFHPNAKTDYGTVNGSSAEFYCDANPRHDIACQNEADTCLTCAACGVNATCSDQVDYHFAEMYVVCASTSTAATASSTPSAPSPQSGGWLAGFLSFLHNIWLSWGWITPSGTPTGANHPPSQTQTGTGAHVLTSPMVGHTGTKLPAQICANGGECKSGNCVRDDQGVYRCSCSPLGNDYSSCH